MYRSTTYLTSLRSRLRRTKRALVNFCLCQRDIPLAHTPAGPDCTCVRPPCRRISSNSGPSRTHGTLLGTTAAKYGPRVTHQDVYLCKDAVDVEKLLYLSRREVYARAKTTGGNALVEEQWFCDISQPLFEKQDRFKVSIHYSATVARSAWPDAQRPVKLEAAQGIGGLMTILDRKD